MKRERPMEGNLIIVSGPSGVGKSTLVNRLIKERPTVRSSVSHTTRAPRGQERNGKDYHFVDEATFEQMVVAGEFVEHARVHAYSYGTSYREVFSAWESGHDLIFDIDYQGAKQLQKRFHTTLAVLIVPPSLEELRVRLEGRQTDAREVIRGRLKVAEHELKQWPMYDYVIQNRDVEVSFRELLSIYDSSRLRVNQNQMWLEREYAVGDD